MGRLQNLLGDQQLKAGDRKVSTASGPGDQRWGTFREPLWICCICEFIGTFLLIFIGCGVGLKFSKEEEDRPLVQIALCWGFLIATLSQSLHYSCDINPAITVAKVAVGKRKILEGAIYVVIQCVGCLAGAYVLKLLTPDDIIGDYGITKLAPQISQGRGVVIEAICTSFLAFTCFSADDKERRYSKDAEITGSKPLSVGLCVASMIMAVAPYTAASFNPARTLGPSIVANNFDDHWVFWVGPIVGGLIGGLTYHHVFRLRRESDSEVEPPPSAV